MVRQLMFSTEVIIMVFLEMHGVPAGMVIGMEQLTHQHSTKALVIKVL